MTINRIFMDRFDQRISWRISDISSMLLGSTPLKEIFMTLTQRI